MPLQAPLSFRWPAEFVARIDAARGDVPRSAFVRRAVERVLPAPTQVRRAVAAAMDEMAAAASPAAVRARPAPLAIAEQAEDGGFGPSFRVSNDEAHAWFKAHGGDYRVWRARMERWRKTNR